MKKQGGLVSSILLAAAGAHSSSGSCAERNVLAKLKDCATFVARGFKKVPEERNQRFLGKVTKETANCRGGSKALRYRDTPWVDWANYWATDDESSKSGSGAAFTLLGKHLKPDGRGIDGALTDLEYQRIELIKFNLFDNQTFEQYVTGRNGVAGRAVEVWVAMHLPSGNPHYARWAATGRNCAAVS